MSGNVFVFSGQGALRPGWLAPLRSDPAIASRLFVADYLAAKHQLPKPSLYCFSPESLDPDEQVSIELFALFSAQVAIAEALAARGLRPAALTAHSFGEYAGLVTAGVLRFDQAFDAIALREQACPPRHSAGYLLAVSSDPDQCGRSLDGVPFWVALKNSSSQSVLALTWNNLLDAEARLASQGIGFRRLSLPQPYHSPLLQSADHKLKQRLQERAFKLQKARTPFLSSVTGEWVTETDSLPDILSKQLSQTVDFAGQIQKLQPIADTFIEIGSLSFLQPFILRSAPAAKTCFFGELLAQDASVSRKPADGALDEEKLAGVRKLIARLTGYEIDRISVEDRIQEDLGIDSLKMMEIVVEVSPKSSELTVGSGLAYPRTVADLVRIAQNTATNGETNHPRRIPKFELMEFTPVPNELMPDSANPENGLVEDVQTWVSQPSLPGATTLVLRQELSDLSTFFAAFNLALSEPARNPRQVGFCFALETEEQGEAIAAFLKSLQKEGHVQALRIVVFDELPGDDEIARTLHHEFTHGSQSHLLRKKGQRFEFRPTPVTGGDGSHFPTRILVIGGASGIGAELIENLPWNQGTEITIWGRSALTPEHAQRMDRWREKGLGIRYQQIDASNKEQVLNQTEDLISFAGVIDLHIWNGAGMERSRDFLLKVESEIQEELDAKLLTALNLVDLCRQLKVAHLIQFSSIIATYGNRGQTIYALSNAYADTLLSARLPTETALTVVRWPPWDSVGMTAKPIVQMALRASGVSLLGAKQAVTLFTQQVSRPLAKGQRLQISPMDLHDTALYQWPPALARKTLQRLGRAYLHDGQPSFARLFNRFADAALWDHRIGESTVLPAALGILMLAEVASKANAGNAGISQFEIHRRVASQTDTLAVRTYIDLTRSEMAFALGNPNVAFRARPLPVCEPPLPAYKAEQDPVVKRIDGPSLYGTGKFFHGPMFQIGGKVAQTETGVLHCEVAAPKRGLEELGFGNAALALDFVFQLASLKAVQIHQRPALPVSVQKVWFAPEILVCEKITACLLYRANQPIPESVVADAQFLDAAGNLIGWMEEIRCQLVSPT